jgi:hypothetical protein
MLRGKVAALAGALSRPRVRAGLGARGQVAGRASEAGAGLLGPLTFVKEL